MEKKKVAHPVKPFWSWNDKLDTKELKSQIDDMKAAGIDGFFMHARGGLETEYLSEDWLKCIEACMDYADELGMEAWAYDENGWPSGFADGIVPSFGENYQQKWLRMKTLEEGEALPPNLLGLYTVDGDEIKMTDSPKKGTLAVYYEINKYYIDVFNKDCIAYFIKTTHEKYREKFGSRMGSSLKGFFTDENQYSGNSAPWSNVFLTLFEEKYGYDVLSGLPLLFMENKSAYGFRCDYYTFVADLFKESFLKQLNDWCEEQGCKLTGHIMGEQSLAAQVAFTGGAMSCYEYFGEPGMDWLGRRVCQPIIPKQLGSVAKQLGKKALTESFAMCGWDVSLNELKGIAESQYVNGVTDLCTHLSAYSIRGYRKRDYPASLFGQLPWFKTAYKAYCDYFVKLGEVLYDGVEVAPLLMLHPMQSIYLLRNLKNETAMRSYDNEFIKLTEKMSGEHILHHYGDETLISRYGSVKGDCFNVGKCGYKAILLPNLLSIAPKTADLLLEFSKNGGKIYCLGSTPRFINGREDERLDSLKAATEGVESVKELKEKISYLNTESIATDDTENPNIHYTARIMPDGSKVYFLVNLTNEKQVVEFRVNEDCPLALWDILTDSYKGVKRDKNKLYLSFAEYGSVILKTLEREIPVDSCAVEEITLSKDFDIKRCDPNALTLDTCQYRIDGGDWQPKKAVITLQNDLLALKRPCKVDLRFTFNVEDISAAKNMKLCAETSEKYTFEINGKPYDFKAEGYYVDKSISRSDISDMVVAGENEIIMSGEFYQKEKVYKILFEPNVHESELNKLTFDTELESIYLIGDFSVNAAKEYTYGENKSIFAGKEFSIAAPKNRVDIEKITESGYLFFSGEMELSKTVSVEKKDILRYKLSFARLNAPGAKLFVNGKEVTTLAFAPFEADVTDYLVSGENEITLILYSGNRNLLGPHHKPYGESYFVGPVTFSDKYGWPEEPGKPIWTDDYSFVKFGVEL